MFASRYFAPRYFPRRYFGGPSTLVLGTPGTRPLVASFADREFRATFLDDPSMPRHVTITIGETLEPIRVLLEHTEDGAIVPLPLGAATVTAFLKGTETGFEKLDVPCEVVNPAATEPTDTDAGEVELDPADLTDLEVDDYQVRFKADYGGGVVQWWPSASHLVLTARGRFTVA